MSSLVGLLCLILLAVQPGATGHAATGGKTAPTRILVKLRPVLAEPVETALPLQTMELQPGQSGNAQIESFLRRYSVRKLAPLYPRIVRIKKQQGLTSLQIATSIRQKFGARASRLHAAFQPPDISRTYAIELDDAQRASMNQIISVLTADPQIEFAEADKVVSVNFTPNDPYFSSSGTWGQAYDDLWGIKKIGAPAAWDTITGSGEIIAIVDTGIDYNHPDIASNVWINTKEIPGNGIDDDGNGFIDDVRGWDFIGSTYTNPVQSNDPIDHFGHGTHVAGTVAAVGNNGIGVIGVAWNAKVMAVKGLDDSGYGIDSTLSNAIIYAANNGANVISNSWAGQGTSQAIGEAISYAYSLGAVIVAAAGNNSDDARNYYPANLPQVITVAATDHNDVQAYFSNWGDKIDVAAPGVDILSLRAAGTSMGTPVDANYTRADGTSMATPHVSGLAALILSRYPAYSNEDVRQVIRVSARSLGTPGFDLNYGYGRINAAAAIAVPDAVEAKILSPVDGTHVSSPTAISGVARGSAFAQYRLEYGAGQTPTVWTLIQSGTTAVAGGTLGVFDPSNVPDGLYVIRLTAYDVSNNAFTDRIELSVNYLSITSPTPPAVPVVSSVFKPGAQVSIIGTATGASFQDFRIDWAEGINPSAGWNNAGMSASGGGASTITNGLLGTWDTTAITNADYYTIRLSVDDAGFTSTAFTLVYLEPGLISQNWPIALDEGTYWSSGIVPSTDASGNQKLTLVGQGTTTTSEFKTFSPDGATQTNSPLTYYGSLFQPATGDLDGNPGDEAAMTDVLMLRIFRGDNSSYTLTPAQTMELANSQVVLEDLNNDSQLEIIAFGEDYNTPNAYVYAYLRNGQQLNTNFPITIANQNTNIDTYTKGNRVFVGDIDGDGNREILALEGTTASTFTLRLFANDGTPKTWSAPAYNGYPDQLVLADLDHNGTLETIFTCSCNSEKELHVLQPDGTERPGWPVILGTYPYYLTYIAVGDLNRDGREEIVVSNSNEIVVLEDNGVSFSNSWPIVGSGYTSFGPVVLADINGDGLPEILTSIDGVGTAPNPLLPSGSAQSASAAEVVRPQISTAIQVDANGNKIMLPRVDVSAQVTSQNLYSAPQIVAYRSDASVARSWNILGANGNQPFYMAKLTVGDFNKDGMTDIAATYWTIEGGGMGGWLKEGVATLLTTGTPYNPQANDWPMIYQNPRNTAVLIRDHTPPNVAVISPASGALLSGQVTVTANAWDNVGVVSLQFQLDGVNLGAPVTTAPFSMVWDTTKSSIGSHTLTAIASDAAGNSAVSAPVTVSVPGMALLTFTPQTVSFGGQLLNTSSPSQSVTLTNTNQVPVSLSGFLVTGDYAETDNCGTSLAAGASCTINIVFNPKVRGTDNGSLTVAGGFDGVAPTVSLNGSGQILQASLSPASLSFGLETLNTSSAPQLVTYSNTGDVPVTISGIAVAGDFYQNNTCGTSLGVGAACSVNVYFVPTVVGARAGTLAVSGNAGGTVSLSGTGQTGQLSVTPTSLSFGNQAVNTTSAAQTITLTSTGTSPATITSWSQSGDYAITNSCPFSLAVGSKCTFGVAFAPTQTGSRPGTLWIYGAFQGSPVTITFSGTGTTTSASLSPSTLTFGNQQVNTTSAAQNLTLLNTGTTPVSISGVQASGDFSQTNNCGSSLAVNSSCKISVVFSPTATGTRTGSLTVASNGSPAIPSASLSGTGVAAVVGPTIDVQVFADQPSAKSTVQTSKFSTSAGNELLLAFISSDASGSGSNSKVNSVTGGGLTWALVQRTNAQRGTAEIWRAFAGSTLSNVTVTATLSQSVSSSLTVMSFTGIDTSGTNGAGAIGATKSASASSGAPTAQLVTTRNGSLVIGVGDDYDKAIARTLGTGQSLVHQYLSPVGDTYWVQMRSATTPLSGTTVVINDTAPTGDRYNLAICEILAAP